MIFLGDIASPNKSTSDELGKVFLDHQKLFSGKRVICNFEGLLYNGEEIKVNEPVLYNHSSILKVLRQGSILCLANNHVLDLPEHFGSTTEHLKQEGFLYCGAGHDQEGAEKPAVFFEGNRKFVLFNFCWDFLLYNHKNPRSGIYVARLQEEKIVECIYEYKKISPESSVLVYLHWNLDMETLPFPMYRQFSKAMIDAGAKIVLGTHSHCVQGGEMYKDGYILYGLGNFFIPDNVYAGGRLKFPDFARHELALEWNIDAEKVICHWFDYQNFNNQIQLKYLGSDDFETSERLIYFSPYRGMSEEEYLKFYKKYRRKRIFIPVYRDYRQKKLNVFYTELLKIRACLAHFLAKYNLIKWQN